MLKIAIDVTSLRSKPSGIGVYITNLVYGLIKLQSESNFNLSLVYQPSLKKWLRGDLSPSYHQNLGARSLAPYEGAGSHRFLSISCFINYYCDFLIF